MIIIIDKKHQTKYLNSNVQVFQNVQTMNKKCILCSVYPRTQEFKILMNTSKCLPELAWNFVSGKNEETLDNL